MIAISFNNSRNDNTIYNIQYPISNIQYPIYNIQYTIYNIQYTIYNMQSQADKWWDQRKIEVKGT